MRRISVDRVTEDMVLAKAIFSSDGNILLNSGVRLREAYIRRFKELNIYELYVDDEISYDIEINDVVSDETRFEARIIVKSIMDSMKYGYKLDSKPVRNIVGHMVEELMSVKDAVVNLQDIKITDQYTFSHCVNVGVLSIITGISMNYDRDKLRELGLSSMLHDIGKTRIPMDVLNKPDRLTTEEFDIIKMHTNYGYEILKKSSELSTYASYVALTHHEKYNGEGYPLGMQGEEIHEFSRIVAIADVYDAITSDRVYRKRVNINEAVEYLIGMGNHHFDYNIVRNFIEHIAIYPPGTGVMLNTGQKAIVVDTNKRYPNRPIIRIVKDEYNNRLRDYEEIDLTKHHSIIITEVIDDI